MTPLPRDPLAVDPARLCAAADDLIHVAPDHWRDYAYQPSMLSMVLETDREFTTAELTEAAAFLKRLGVTA